MSCARGVAVVVVVAGLCAAPGLAFPSFDVASERVLLGAPPVPGAQQEPLPHAARGSFSVDDSGGLSLRERPAFGDAIWLSDANVGDGLVRARFVAGARLDVSVVLRAAAHRLVNDLDDAVLVSLERNKLAVYSVRDSVVRATGSVAAFSLPGPTQTLELVVQLTGGVLSAALYDGATLLPLAQLQTTVGGPRQGRVGVRLHRASGADTRVTLLSVMRPSVQGPGGPKTGAHSPLDDHGRERAVWLAPQDVARLPRELQKVVVDDTDGPALVVDATAAERVLRLGIAPRKSTAAVPYRLIDPALRARLSKPPHAPGANDAGTKDAALVEATLRDRAQRYPDITRLVPLGQSHQGRTIWALLISDHAGSAVHDAEHEPALLLDGGYHGGELMAVEQVIDAIDTLLLGHRKDAGIRALVNGLAIWCVPLVNVDGNMRFVHDDKDHDRKNARDVDGDGMLARDEGVDLYRNFPLGFGHNGEVGSRSRPSQSRYRGPAGGSEPEVQAMMALAEQQRFVASIDFHTSATLLLSPYTDPLLVNPDGDEAWPLAQALVAQLPSQPSGRRYEVRRNLYPVDGTAQDWLRHQHGTVAFLIEGPLHNPLPSVRGRQRVVEATRPSWRWLAERVLRGPGVSGRVVDDAGAPVAATVTLSNQGLRQGERWTARPRDGLYHRLVAAPGPLTVRFEAEGYAPVERRVVVGAGVVRLDVTLSVDDRLSE
jgi:hypothetical protein